MTATKMKAKTRNKRSPEEMRAKAALRMTSIRALLLTIAGIISGVVPFLATAELQAQTTAPARSAPTRPGAPAASGGVATTTPRTTPATTTGAPATTSATTASGTVKFDGNEYLELTAYAKTLGLATSWTKPAEVLLLKKTGTKIEISGDTREFSINDTRVFAGFPIRMYKRSLWISRIDAETLLKPIAETGKSGRTAPTLKVIAIDAGHGGIDKGKINDRLKIFEKTVALDTANRLKTLLEKQGYKVVMTRTTDKKIDLAERPEIATKAGADLFISIHFNSVEQGAQKVSGVEVYRFTPRNQPPITRTNIANEDKLANPGDANNYWSSVVGLKIHESLLADLKAPDRGFKHHKFAVLRLATCPAVLVEAGFLSNDTEAGKIATPAYRQKIAEALADGVKGYADELAVARGK